MGGKGPKSCTHTTCMSRTGDKVARKLFPVSCFKQCEAHVIYDLGDEAGESGLKACGSAEPDTD